MDAYFSCFFRQLSFCNQPANCQTPGSLLLHELSELGVSPPGPGAESLSPEDGVHDVSDEGLVLPGHGGAPLAHLLLLDAIQEVFAILL